MKKARKAKAKQLFAKSEYESLDGQNLTDKVLVLNPEYIRESMRQRDNMLWVAKSGFGCSPTAIGTAVYCEKHGDTNVQQRWERYEFLGIYKGA